MNQPYIYKDHPAETEDAPTLVVLHGTGGDEFQFFDLGRTLMPDARLVSPRGDVLEGGANRFFRRTAEGVYDMDDLRLRTEKMVGFLKSVKGSGPLVGLGYSNGANILASAMIAAPGLVDRAVLMHPLIPWVPSDADEVQATDVLVTAGRRDPFAPADKTEALIAWFGRNGARIDAFWHEGGHEIAQGELAAVAGFLSGRAV